MQPGTPISPNCVIVRNPNLLVNGLDDELVMLSIERGKYYGAETVGSRILTLIEKPMAVFDLCATLMDEFEVDLQTCEAQVLAFVTRLQQEDLIVVSADAGH